MTFNVKYRKTGSWIWRTIKNVKGDTVTNFMGRTHWMLIREDDSSALIPVEGMEFQFDAGRHQMIQERLHEESNGVIPKES